MCCGKVHPSHEPQKSQVASKSDSSSDKCLTSLCQLFRGDSANRAFMVKSLPGNLHGGKATSRRDLFGHKEWTLDQRKSLLWSDESKFKTFGSTCRVFVRRRKGERTVFYKDGSHCEAWRTRDAVEERCWSHCLF